MPKTRIQKVEILKKISEKMQKSKSLYFAKINKLTVNDSQHLRGELRKENSEFIVAPKTITNIALKDSNLTQVDAKNYEGQMALVLAYGDEVIPAKIIAKFQKESKENAEKIQLVGGLLEGREITAADTIQLANMPGRLELYAQLVGSLNAPVSGFVNVLAGNLRGLVCVLKAIEESKA
jgi:large subunit ribosomal protein L10